MLHIAGTLVKLCAFIATFSVPTYFADPEHCDLFISLVEKKMYLDARSLIIKEGEQGCMGPQYRTSYARLLVAENKFRKAKVILEEVLKEYPQDSIASRELTRCLRAMGRSVGYAPITISPLPTGNTNSRDLIALASPDGPVVLRDTTTSGKYLPIRSPGYSSLVLIDSANVMKLRPRIIRKLESRGIIEFGPSCFISDSELLLTCTKRVPYAKTASANSYQLLLIDIESVKIDQFPLKRKGAIDAFPAFRVSDSLVVFSSDRGGNMDLWFTKRTGKNWNSPVMLGSSVNSQWNEVLPVFCGDTLFFSSDRPDNGYGSLDIYGYSFTTDSLWNVGLPLNSAYDDHSLWQTSTGEGFMVSTRPAGLGLSDIYELKWDSRDLFFGTIHGEVSNSENLIGEEIVLADSEGSIIQRSVIDSSGKFVLNHVKGVENYRLDISSVDINQGAELKLFDSEKNLIAHVKSVTENGFFFGLLTPKDYFMEPLNLVDESILAVDVIGRILSSKSENVGGFKIILTDRNGDILATTQTGSQGEFQFEKVKPDNEYHIKSEVKDAFSVIYIVDGSGEVIQTIEPGQYGDFIFVRLDERDKIVTLTNEFNERIRISDKEQFKLSAIQYEYNSAQLSEAGISVLDRLSELLQLNPNVAVELSGHTDAKGNADYNQKLSEKRISNAIDYLLSIGVESKRMRGVGYGESRLLMNCEDPDCTEEDHALNRRTELRIFYPER